MSHSQLGMKPHAAATRGIARPKELNMIPCASCGHFTTVVDARDWCASCAAPPQLPSKGRAQ